jgi:hypothetical protein
VFTQLVVTKSGNTLTFYKNGVQVGATKTNSETYSGGAITAAYFGYRFPNTTAGTTEAFDGQFNVIRVYDGVLSAAQVLQNYNSTLNNTTYTLDALNVADAAVIVGGSTTFDSRITNTGAGFAANTVDFTGLSATVSGGGTISGAAGSGNGLATSANAAQGLTYDSTGSSIGVQTITSTLNTAINGDKARATQSGSSTASVTVLAHSNAEFADVSGAATGTPTTNALTLDFGTVAQGTGGGSLDAFFDVVNEIVVAGFTAGLDLDTLTAGTGDVSQLFLQSGPTTFNNLAAGTGQGYTWRLDTTTPGMYSAVYEFLLSDQNLPGATAPNSEVLTLTLTANVTQNVVPEPGSIALWSLLSVSLIGYGAWRRRKR